VFCASKRLRPWTSMQCDTNSNRSPQLFETNCLLTVNLQEVSTPLNLLSKLKSTSLRCLPHLGRFSVVMARLIHIKHVTHCHACNVLLLCTV